MLGLAALCRDASWQEFTATVKASVESFLPRFEEMARTGPEEDREILESMVRHEASILRWVSMESRGETDGSLDDMLAQVQYPLPPS